MTGLTALIAMRDVAAVRTDTRVLINGAAGGVGTIALQIAKVLGAEVTGGCSTSNVELVRSLGADHVIDYQKEDFTQSRQRFDVILDNVLNHPPQATAQVLAPTGLLIPNGECRILLTGSTLVEVASCLVRSYIRDPTREAVGGRHGHAPNAGDGGGSPPAPSRWSVSAETC